MNIVEHVVLEQKLPVGRVQSGNERGIAGGAHDVFDCARQFTKHPRRVHEMNRISRN